MTTQELLDSVQAAITAIEGGAQEYRIGSRVVRRADLRTLYQREEDLLARLQNEGGGGSMCGYGVPEEAT